MSVVIVFPNKAEWFRANWMFRQLAEDTSRGFPSDSDVKQEMEKARGIGALFLDTMERPLSSRVMERLRAVVQDTLEGKVSGWRRDDESGRSLYLESLSELLALLKKNIEHDNRTQPGQCIMRERPVCAMRRRKTEGTGRKIS